MPWVRMPSRNLPAHSREESLPTVPNRPYLPYGDKPVARNQPSCSSSLPKKLLDKQHQNVTALLRHIAVLPS
jgi:hypothetical protein